MCVCGEEVKPLGPLVETIYSSQVWSDAVSVSRSGDSCLYQGIGDPAVGCQKSPKSPSRSRGVVSVCACGEEVKPLGPLVETICSSQVWSDAVSVSRSRDSCLYQGIGDPAVGCQKSPKSPSRDRRVAAQKVEILDRES